MHMKSKIKKTISFMKKSKEELIMLIKLIKITLKKIQRLVNFIQLFINKKIILYCLQLKLKDLMVEKLKVIKIMN